MTFICLYANRRLYRSLNPLWSSILLYYCIIIRFRYSFLCFSAGLCIYESKHIICVAVTAVYILCACDVLYIYIYIYVYICGRVLSNCRNASGAVGNFESVFYSCASRKRFMAVREKTTDHMWRRRRSHIARRYSYHGPGIYNIMSM